MGTIWLTLLMGRHFHFLSFNHDINPALPYNHILMLLTLDHSLQITLGMPAIISYIIKRDLLYIGTHTHTHTHTCIMLIWCCAICNWSQKIFKVLCVPSRNGNFLRQTTLYIRKNCMAVVKRDRVWLAWRRSDQVCVLTCIVVAILRS